MHTTTFILLTSVAIWQVLKCIARLRRLSHQLLRLDLFVHTNTYCSVSAIFVERSKGASLEHGVCRLMTDEQTADVVKIHIQRYEQKQRDFQKISHMKTTTRLYLY